MALTSLCKTNQDMTTQIVIWTTSQVIPHPSIESKSNHFQSLLDLHPCYPLPIQHYKLHESTISTFLPFVSSYSHPCDSKPFPCHIFPRQQPQTSINFLLTDRNSDTISDILRQLFKSERYPTDRLVPGSLFLNHKKNVCEFWGTTFCTMQGNLFGCRFRSREGSLLFQENAVEEALLAVCSL